MTTLGSRTATWTALSAPAKFIVEDLDARSECYGKAIYLSWVNPAGATQVKIVRRLKQWPFDLTDSHDVLYEGAPISSFTDTGIVSPSHLLTLVGGGGGSTITVDSVAGWNLGDLLRVETLTGDRRFEEATISSIVGLVVGFTAGLSSATYPVGSRVSISKPLLPQTYYYYLVLVSDDLGPAYAYDIDDPARIFALSIDVFTGKQWFIDNSTQHAVEMDAKTAAEGGGGGFLDKWFTIMGCWLNTMRGHLNAVALLGDPDKAPFHALTAKNQSLGIDPEGFAFDYDIVRRPLTSLIHVYKRKGTCPGIVETIRMFTKWEADCVEFGFNACAGGASGFRMWDGLSQSEYGLEGITPFTIECTSALGAGRFRDSTKTWANDLWKDGTLRGWMGDIACIDTNVDDVVTLLAPKPLTSLNGAALAGANSIVLQSTSGIQPGMRLQITSATETAPGSGIYMAEIIEAFSIIIPGTTIFLRSPLVNAYPTGSIVTIGKSIIREEELGVVDFAVGQTIQNNLAAWVTDQWKGYKVFTSDGNIHNITSNTPIILTVDGAAPVAGNDFAIAYDFTGFTFAGRNPLVRYKISNGQHSTWWEPTYDLEVRGTVYDPYNRLWGGTGLALTGNWGPQDIAAYITTPVTVVQGEAQGVAGFIFTLDPSEPPPVANALVGMWLNPNQNQNQVFEILANTTTTLTIAGEISSLVVAGQYYYVLKPRDKVRFERITSRLRKEFTDTDVKIHVLFV